MSYKVLFVSIIALGIKLSYGGPLHASCKVDWTFGISCSDVSQKLQDQIKAWEGDAGCKDGGEKCFYKITSVSETELKATHTTPVKKYVDSLTFNFKQNANTVLLYKTFKDSINEVSKDIAKDDATSCNVHGYSTSQTWYAILDYGTNYCNLHNLITGAKLDKVTGYSEKASDSTCTQFSSADCDKY